jgi:hypothetical protein
MPTYRETIRELLQKTPFGANIDLKVEGRPPTMANSEFLTNKEQGDWAEQIVFNAINGNSNEYCALTYGRGDSIAAGDAGFHEFYSRYLDELNTIGKRPDLLIFRREDVLGKDIDLNDEGVVSKAVAALEVRSSSFLAKKYALYMDARTREATRECLRLKTDLLSPACTAILQEKRPEILKMIQESSEETFKELDFRLPTWSSSPDLQAVSALLKELKEQMKVLGKRAYLSITPKVEDLALVNRWIQRFGVRHYYLQVFFDKAYVISFKDILSIISDSAKEDVLFSIERDVKNQGKTTIKIDVQVGKEILGRIDMPEHRSAMKEFERGRLLFYVTFHGGRGYLDSDVFDREIVNDLQTD